MDAAEEEPAGAMTVVREQGGTSSMACSINGM
jgi:hypothetical protein